MKKKQVDRMYLIQYLFYSIDIHGRFTNVDYQQTVENLKVKLSLKKQVWNGISNSVDINNVDGSSNYQPLSWGISVVNKKKPFKLDPNEELFA